MAAKRAESLQGLPGLVSYTHTPDACSGPQVDLLACMPVSYKSGIS